MFAILSPHFVADQPAYFAPFCRCRHGLYPRFLSCNEQNAKILPIMHTLTLILSIWVAFDVGMLVFACDSVVVAPTFYPHPTFADCSVYIMLLLVGTRLVPHTVSFVSFLIHFLSF